MKFLAACFLTIALLFRAAPLCAVPIAEEQMETMPGCEHPETPDKKMPDQKNHDAARTCQSCVFPFAVEAVLAQPLPPLEIARRLQTAPQLSGNALKPPVPPPRTANRANFQNLIGEL